MISKKLIRKCPICTMASGSVIHNQSFAFLEGSPLPDNYDVVHCSNCGFVFADTTGSQDDYNTYYTLLSKYEDLNTSSGGGFNQNDFNRLVRTAEFLDNHLNKNNSIVDLGCANGGLLKILKDKGFKNLMGVDPSKACIENVKLLGIETFRAHLFEQSFINWDNKFDLIILSHVLEHIQDLREVIKIISKKLTQNGIIYIEVPDASRYHNYFIVPYYYIDCEHINHFSEVSLQNLMLQFGFTSDGVIKDIANLNETCDYPILYSLFRKTNKRDELLPDSAVIESFRIFLDQSKELNHISCIIEEVVSSQEEIVIWGAGQFALRLLASSSLSKANVLGFVDSDRSKQNKKIGNYDVFSPDFLLNKEVTLLICSALYSNEILKAAQAINKEIKYIILN